MAKDHWAVLSRAEQSPPDTASGEAERCRLWKGQLWGHGASAQLQGTPRQPVGGGPGTSDSRSKKLEDMEVWPLALMEEG